jgi:hypothetical protein
MQTQLIKRAARDSCYFFIHGFTLSQTAYASTDNRAKSIDYTRGNATVYRFVLTEWVDYMLHLKQDYPYRFSVAVRANPFMEDAEVAIRG